ncbi:MAG TPA: hypothetical protein IGS17_04320 [Oscillatoriales cyanobacterium M59_W2019_021]|nr:hypothetical protein [Oscillatoriales cyanobacterium M4454_W2019_049]HIK50142.1 hypothetical protein [Oscillatoriales cyanobacterium M59_W2019_021]
MSSEPNPKPIGQLRSIFSITLFVILTIGVAYLSWNFIAALIAKFA